MAEVEKSNSDTKNNYNTMEKNPVNNKRIHTDTSSLLIFSGFLLLYIGISIYAFCNGDIRRLELDEYVNKYSNFEKHVQMVNDITSEILASRFVILCSMLFAGSLSVLFIGILPWIPGFFIWTAIVFECLTLVYFIFSIPMYFVYPESYFRLKDFILLLIFIVFTIVKLKIFKKVGSRVICEVIKESCRTILNFPSSIVLSVFIIFLEILTLFFGLLVFSNLTTIKSSYATVVMSRLDECVCPSELMYDDGSPCNVETFNSLCRSNNSMNFCTISSCQTYYNSTPVYIYIFHAVNVIVGLWFGCFIYYYGQMILSGTFASWYWSMNKNTVPRTTILKSTLTSTRYHLGTLAYGTSPWVIITMICIIFTCIRHRLNEFSKQPITILLCWWSIFSKIADNGFTVCSIHGTAFKQSAKAACDIFMRNPLRFFIINKAIEWLAVFMIIFVSLLTTLTTSSYLTTQFHTTESYYIILITIATGTAITVAPIVALLSVSVNTILLCIIEDSERNAGSKEKTYYMNDNLKELFVTE